MTGLWRSGSESLPHVIRAVVAAVALTLCAGPARGDTIFESAFLGPTGQAGGALIGTLTPGSDQLIGARFHIDRDVQVDAIGGHITGLPSPLGSEIFGAIVTLDSMSAFPSGDPFNSTTIAVTTFVAPMPSVDLRVAVSTILAPGNYALIFGSNRFGATGIADMPTNNLDRFGITPYFFWDPQDARWRNTTDGGLRFVVTGDVIEPVPESPTFSLLILGALAAAGLRAAGRKRPLTTARSIIVPRRSESPLQTPTPRGTPTGRRPGAASPRFS